ncbi:acyltransferase family protein [Catellatospora tritici]|uniref:acyltransferase family protein n=1 Tax=Catellatospora tritici TaxID=2851566 RepID=UPI001C2DE4D6|nr:acyltransferase [Catellatospora tritici]MBV1853859.1 acyltransferase [Catellatospora tritici]
MATEQLSDPTVTSRRRPELDAIRTLVVVGLVFFHSALVFDAHDDYYVKNADTTELTTVLAGFAVIWAMPMLFLIAGFGARHSLRRRGPGGFATERLLRLGVPLAFAEVALLPLPQYLRLRAADPGYHDSYLDFLPDFFRVRLAPDEFPFLLEGEYFESGHLWFVVMLLAYALLLAAATAALPRPPLRRLRDRLATAVHRRGLILLPALPVALISAVVGLEEGFAGWSRWAYLLFFLYGCVLATDDRFRAAMRRDRFPALCLGLILFLGSAWVFFGLLDSGADPFLDPSGRAAAGRAAFGAAGWCWLVAILGLLDRPRTPTAPRERTGPFARAYAYLATGALPLYILHQPIVVTVAYVVVGWHAPILAKYAALVTVALALTLAAYDLLVRRTRVTRFLFGMREPAPVTPTGEDPPGPPLS